MHRLQTKKEVYNALWDMLKRTRGKIASGDEAVVQSYLRWFDVFVENGKSPWDVLKVAERNETGSSTDQARDPIAPIGDNAMNGGIDLDTSKIHMAITGDGSVTMNTIDPALLAGLENASGFAPKILTITPVAGLDGFLAASH